MKLLVVLALVAAAVAMPQAIKKEDAIKEKETELKDQGVPSGEIKVRAENDYKKAEMLRKCMLALEKKGKTLPIATGDDEDMTGPETDRAITLCHGLLHKDGEGEKPKRQAPLEEEDHEVASNETKRAADNNCRNHDGELWDITKKIYVDMSTMDSKQAKAIDCALADYKKKLPFFRFTKVRVCNAGVRNCMKFTTKANAYGANSCSGDSHVGYTINHEPHIVRLTKCNWVDMLCGILIHEIGHALGVHHEQSRPDRNQYMNINLNNVIKNTEHNFDKSNWVEISRTTSGAYDPHSIMHYKKNTFSKGHGNIITMNDRRLEDVIGTAKELSKGDVRGLYNMYHCGTATACLVNGDSELRKGQNTKTGNPIFEQYFGKDMTLASGCVRDGSRHNTLHTTTTGAFYKGKFVEAGSPFDAYINGRKNRLTFKVTNKPDGTTSYGFSG